MINLLIYLVSSPAIVLYFDNEGERNMRKESSTRMNSVAHLGGALDGKMTAPNLWHRYSLVMTTAISTFMNGMAFLAVWGMIGVVDLIIGGSSHLAMDATPWLKTPAFFFFALCLVLIIRASVAKRDAVIFASLPDEKQSSFQFKKYGTPKTIDLLYATPIFLVFAFGVFH